ncbi:helix-turn-helix domain-containing protein [Saccharopolyspora spinosa]|uniref:Excisionase family DNA binding protein n=1 Tax=Saccharopolyspora spinosa TaxID=60894 RepID=A0A2N3XSJ3_SACSN|nr:helix-turn-helix domain-containing protein [Saccharopolyspora spinosa]PKW13657.1 excisionase family DNA binding protein [Saccharopolyspora spinosa]
MAAQLNISDRGLRRLVAADRIPYYRVGRELRFNPAEVLRALRSQAGGDGNAA